LRFIFLLFSVFALGFLVSCHSEDPLEDVTDEESDDSDDNLDGIHEQASDYTWTSSDVRQITLNGSSITVSGSGANASGSTLTITSAGNYSISGSLSNGKIVVNTSDNDIVRLILNGVTVACSNSAPLYISKADKVLVYLTENTVNTFTDGSSYSGQTDNEPKAAIFSTANLSIAGTGSLTVKGNYNDGISTKDGLVIKNGNLTVTAADDAIRGKDYVVIREGTFTLTSAGDGLVSDNDGVSSLGFITIDAGTFRITSGGDAIQAVTETTVNGGNLTLISGGGSSKTITNTQLSAKGIKSGKALLIHDGTFDINSADDAVHSGGTLTIEKGTLAVSTADDAFHAEGALTVQNGTISVTKSYEAFESPAITVNNGSINLVASNDGFNATKGTVAGGTEQNDGSVLKIAGGYVVTSVSQGDGIDSNGSFDMTGGTLIVHGPQSQPEVGMDVNGASTISGGMAIISGPASNMTESFANSSSQYSILATTNTSLSSSTLFHIRDANGNNIVTFQPGRPYSTIAFSSESLKSGTTYYIYTGGSCTGTKTDGMYSGGTYSGGTQKKSFTLSSKATSLSF